MEKQYSKEIMDKAVSMLFDYSVPMRVVSDQLGIPITSIRSELQARGLRLRRNEQMKWCQITVMLARLLEQYDAALSPIDQNDVQWIEDAERFNSLVNEWAQACIEDSEVDKKRLKPLLSEYTAKATLSQARLLWAKTCSIIANNLLYKDVEAMLEMAEMYYDTGTVEFLKNEFLLYMSIKQKRWIMNSAKDYKSITRIKELWAETATRSDGKLIHLWLQAEIARECGVTQAYVSQIINKED